MRKVIWAGVVWGLTGGVASAEPINIKALVDDKSPVRVVMTPSDMPPQRTVCEVRTNDIVSRVEWSPEQLSTLRQSVLLPPGALTEGGQVHCWSAVPKVADESAPRPYWMPNPPTGGRKWWKVVASDNEEDSSGSTEGSGGAQECGANERETLTWEGGADWITSFCFDVRPADFKYKSASPRCDAGQAAVFVEVKPETRRNIANVLHNLDTELAGQSAERSLFNPVPEIVGETLTVLGDIALKRAEKRARELVVDRLMAGVCGDGIALFDRWVRASPTDEDGSKKRWADAVGVLEATGGVQPKPPTDEGRWWDTTCSTSSPVGDCLRVARLAVQDCATLYGDPWEVEPWGVDEESPVGGQRCASPGQLDDVQGRLQHRGQLEDLAETLEAVGGASTPTERRLLALGRMLRELLDAKQPRLPSEALTLTLVSGPTESAWRLDCRSDSEDVSARGVKVFIDSGEDTTLELLPSCDVWLQVATDLRDAHFVVRAPSEPPHATEAVLSVNKKGRWTLAGGEASQPFGFSLDNTCDVIRDRPFADLARSGPVIAKALQSDLIDTLIDNLERVRFGEPALDALMVGTVHPIVELTLPVLLDAAREGRPLRAREGQAMIAGLRGLLRDQASAPPGSPCMAGHAYLQVGLAILSDCIDQGVCDLRQVAAKVAQPGTYFDLHADRTCTPFTTAGGNQSFEDWTTQSKPLSVAQQRQLVAIVDGLYAVFAPGSDLGDRQRASAGVGALFDIVRFSLSVADAGPSHRTLEDAAWREALVGVLDDTKRLSLAGLESDLAASLKEAMSLVSNMVRLIAHDPACSPPAEVGRGDDRRECVRTLAQVSERIDGVLPWVTTLVAHAEQLKEERSGSLSEQELEDQAAARRKALEELIDQSTRRKERHGDWVVGLGANVGVRGAVSIPHGLATIPIAPASTLDEDRVRWAPTPLSLPIGLAIQWLPHPTGAASTRFPLMSQEREQNALQSLRADGSPPTPKKWGTGMHMQFSAVDVGQFLIAGEEIRGVTWNEFLIANAQVGLMFGTPRDAFTFSVDYRYVPAMGTRGAHQVGAVLSYYVPFLDFN